MSDPASIVAQLASVIRQRQKDRPGGSYTVELLDGGYGTIAPKIIEEAYELIAAGAEESPNFQDVAHEAADLVYHLLVLLTSVGVAWSDVERELASRFGVSGLAEKAQRERPA